MGGKTCSDPQKCDPCANHTQGGESGIVTGTHPRSDGENAPVYVPFSLRVVPPPTTRNMRGPWRMHCAGQTLSAGASNAILCPSSCCGG